MTEKGHVQPLMAIIGNVRSSKRTFIRAMGSRIVRWGGENMYALRNRVFELRPHLGRVLSEPVGRLVGAYNTGIVETQSGLCEFLAFGSLQVTKQNRASRRLDSAMARRSQGSNGKSPMAAPPQLL